MALTKKLQTQIEKFLENKKKSEGGWAPVDEGEIDELSEIVYALIEAKYQRDPDGDLPVSAHLTDRTRFKLPLILPIPHTRDEAVPDVSAMLEAMSNHLSMAASHSESANTLMRLVRGDIRVQADADRPVKLQGKVFRPVPTPKEGVVLEEEWLKERARKLFFKEESKNPCPSDWDERKAWADRLVKKLREDWGVFVAVEACSITTSGLSVRLNVPAIDKVIRFNVGAKADAI
jgi:hypothetical protein